jgi:hypothetical protein
MFKGAISTAAEISPPEHRAETLAGMYLAAYVGLAGPVIGLGALTQVASTRVSLLVFGAVLALGTLAAAPALLAGQFHATHDTSTTNHRSNDGNDSPRDNTARQHRHGDHAGGVRRMGRGRRRVGVRVGPAGR